MQPRYEVQHFTLCDGWVNTWSDEDGDAIVYATESAAHRALAEWLKEMQEDCDIEEQYGEWEFRVVQSH